MLLFVAPPSGGKDGGSEGGGGAGDSYAGGSDGGGGEGALTMTALNVGADTAVSVAPTALEREDVLALLIVLATAAAAEGLVAAMLTSAVMDAALTDIVIASVDTLVNVARFALNASCAVASKALMVDAIMNATFTTCLTTPPGGVGGADGGG